MLRETAAEIKAADDAGFAPDRNIGSALAEFLEVVASKPDQQISPTGPDVRSMPTSGPERSFNMIRLAQRRELMDSVIERQPKTGPRTASLYAIDLDAAAMLLHDLLDHGQTEAHAEALGAEHRLKDLR